LTTYHFPSFTHTTGMTHSLRIHYACEPLSVRPPGTTLFPLEGLSWNDKFEFF